MADVLTIKADDPTVLSLYHKQKLEFRFQQKSDNDFLYFLLDTTMRVISIVEQLAPVFEVVTRHEKDPHERTTSSPEEDEEEVLDMETGDNPRPELSTPLLSQPPPLLQQPTPPQRATFSPKVISQLASGPATPPALPPNLPTFSLAAMSKATESSPISNPTNLTEINKTISQLQRELDSVSQALEISRTSPAITTTDPTRSNDFGAFLGGRGSEPPPPSLLSTKDPNSGGISSLLAGGGGVKDSQLDIIKQLQESLLYGKAKGGEVKSEPVEMVNGGGGGDASEQRLQQLVSSFAASTQGVGGGGTALSALPGLLKKNPLSMLHLSRFSLDQTNLFERSSQASPDAPTKTECSSTSAHSTTLSNSHTNKASPNNDRFTPNISGHHRFGVSPTDHVGCYVCGKVFRGSSRAQNLKRHFNNVHLKLKPFRCNVCGMMFGLKYNLKSHISRAHAMVSFPAKSAESLIGIVESTPEPPIEPLASLPPSLAPQLSAMTPASE